MARIDRRTFLAGTAAAGGAALAGPFAGFVAGRATAAPSTTLGPVPDLRGGQVRLWLPEGFQYRSFHDTEQRVLLDDGTVLPGRHDGMAAFRGDAGNVLLVRNHEINNPVPAFGDAGNAYDAMAGGGTTTTNVTRFGQVIGARTSLNGTQMNCSGGRMPGAPGSRARRRSTVPTSPRTSPASRMFRSPSGTGSSSRCPHAASPIASRSPPPGASRTRPWRLIRATACST
jgi:Alkaline phosphatase PhoX